MTIIVDNIATLYYNAPSNASRDDDEEDEEIQKIALKLLKIY